MWWPLIWRTILPPLTDSIELKTQHSTTTEQYLCTISGDGHTYTSGSSYLADQVLVDLHPNPLWNANFREQVLADLPPPTEWQFHRFLLWLLVFHSYSESSYLADQVLADQVYILPVRVTFSLVFCRKYLCEAEHETQCVQIFRCPFCTHVRCTPQKRHLVVKRSTTSGDRSAWHFQELNGGGILQSDIPSSDVPPISEI